MSELKTFEDFGNDNLRNCDFDYGWDDGQQDIKEDLKQEAIKDIKILLKDTEFLLPMQGMKGDYVLDSKSKKAIINYIKLKFNITEEDLKNV